MKRDITFDIMKGIAIIAVLIGHTDGLNIWEKNFIYSFHMPLFFILSGYFFKDKNETVSNIAKKDFKRLIVPYLFTCLFLLMYTVLYSWKKHNIQLLYDELLATVWATGYYHNSLLMGDVRYIGPIWFLASLFWCKLVYVPLYRNVRKTLLLPISLIISIGAILLDYYVVNLPFGILPGLSVMLFFSCGFAIKENMISKWFKWFSVFCWPIAIWYGTEISVFPHNPWICVCRYACWPLDVVGAIGGVYVIFFLSQQIALHISFLSRAFAWCGRYSLLILCIHVLELNTAVFTIFYQTIHVDVNLMLMLFTRIIFVILLTMMAKRFFICQKVFQIS